MSIAQPCQTAARVLTETTAAYRRFLSTLSQQPTQCILLIDVTETFKFSLECIWLEPGDHACPCVGVHRPPGAWLDGHTPVIRRICWCIHQSTTHSAFLGPRLATIQASAGQVDVRCQPTRRPLHLAHRPAAATTHIGQVAPDWSQRQNQQCLSIVKSPLQPLWAQSCSTLRGHVLMSWQTRKASGANCNPAQRCKTPRASHTTTTTASQPVHHGKP